MFKKKPILAGNSDIAQMQLTFSLVGSPTEETMPGYRQLPGAEAISGFPPKKSTLQHTFQELHPLAVSLLSELLRLDWRKRINAIDALDHPYFTTPPLPAPLKEIPKFEDSHEFDRRRFRGQKENQQAPVIPTNDTRADRAKSRIPGAPPGSRIPQPGHGGQRPYNSRVPDMSRGGQRPSDGITADGVEMLEERTGPLTKIHIFQRIMSQVTDQEVIDIIIEIDRDDEAGVPSAMIGQVQEVAETSEAKKNTIGLRSSYKYHIPLELPFRVSLPYKCTFKRLDAYPSIILYLGTLPARCYANAFITGTTSSEN
ncbi:serine/threonine protein kinase, CMGC, CDC2/CDK sub [Ascosphaera aggregata]|nr:serine/threonine protein kinase, CMGC, CDC2/CDK sub [Ascosphaera aggregata]